MERIHNIKQAPSTWATIAPVHLVQNNPNIEEHAESITPMSDYSWRIVWKAGLELSDIERILGSKHRNVIGVTIENLKRKDDKK